MIRARFCSGVATSLVIAGMADCARPRLPGGPAIGASGGGAAPPIRGGPGVNGAGMLPPTGARPDDDFRVKEIGESDSTLRGGGMASMGAGSEAAEIGGGGRAVVGAPRGDEEGVEFFAAMGSSGVIARGGGTAAESSAAIGARGGGIAEIEGLLAIGGGGRFVVTGGGNDATAGASTTPSAVTSAIISERERGVTTILRLDGERTLPEGTDATLTLRTRMCSVEEEGDNDGLDGGDSLDGLFRMGISSG